MQGLGIIILIVLFFWIVWPYISRWLKRKATEKAEDYLRAQMGMPPRDKKSRKGSFWSGSSESSHNSRQRERRNPFGPDSYTRGPIIPKEYAEDVEFVETKDYSETERRTVSGSESYHESQISDAEYTEIKKSGSK